MKIDRVLKGGRWIRGEQDIPAIEVPPPKKNSIRYELPKLRDLSIQGGEGHFRVIEVIPNQIITNALDQHIAATDQEIKSDLKKDILKISVLERHGHGKPMVTALVKGFSLKKGALAASVAHDSHNVVVVGANDEDMLKCFHWMKESGGGFVAVNQGRVTASLALPIAGLMTDEPAKSVYKNLKALRKAATSFGCRLDEPFLQLAFLCLPVIPTLKITDLGLVDVNQFNFVNLRIDAAE